MTDWDSCVYGAYKGELQRWGSSPTHTPFPWLCSQLSESTVSQMVFCVKHMDELAHVHSRLRSRLIVLSSIIENVLLFITKDGSVLTLHCLPKVVQVFYLKHKLIMKVRPMRE